MAESKAIPDPITIARAIVEEARAAGVDPGNALVVAVAESGLNPAAHAAVGEDSWGVYQLNRKSVLGVSFERETGLSLADPSTWREQIRWVMRHVRDHGWGAWTAARALRIDTVQPGQRAPAVTALLLEGMPSPSLLADVPTVIGVVRGSNVARNVLHFFREFGAALTALPGGAVAWGPVVPGPVLQPPVKPQPPGQPPGQTPVRSPPPTPAAPKCSTLELILALVSAPFSEGSRQKIAQCLLKNLCWQVVRLLVIAACVGGILVQFWPAPEVAVNIVTSAVTETAED